MARCFCQVGKLLDSVGIPNRFSQASFESFRAPNPSGNALGAYAASQALVACAEYVTSFPNNHRKGLILIGPPGTGKTHLAVAMLKEVLSKQFQVSAASDGRFIDHRELFKRSGALLKDLGDTNLVVLDDLGAGPIDSIDSVSSLISQRYNDNMPLVVTTNLLFARNGHQGMTLTERIGERSASRLMEHCSVIELFGLPDYRQDPF